MLFFLSLKFSILSFPQGGDLLTFSVSPSGSESEALGELADINWSVVSPESIRDYENRKRESEARQRRSRMAPDGGNPLEDMDL